MQKCIFFILVLIDIIKGDAIKCIKNQLDTKLFLLVYLISIMLLGH